MSLIEMMSRQKIRIQEGALKHTPRYRIFKRLWLTFDIYLMKEDLKDYTGESIIEDIKKHLS